MKRPRPMNRPYKLYLLAVLIVTFIGLYLWNSLGLSETKIGYGEFKQLLATEGVKFTEINLTKELISGRVSKHPPAVDADHVIENERFRTSRAGIDNDPELIKLLDQHAADYNSVTSKLQAGQVKDNIFWLMLLLLFCLGFLIVMKRVSGSGSLFGLGGRKHQLIGADESTGVKFEDVAGIEEAKDELKQVVDFLRNPVRYTRAGARIPKGVLLIGPPGTGKTLLARSVAGEADRPFFHISGSDFMEMFVGVGAKRVRELFRDAEAAAPCIVFIDEIDTLGRNRSAQSGNAHEEREQTLNQLLVEMDGFRSDRGVIVLGATNRPDILDPALLRPGRFDCQVYVDRPDLSGRKAILQVHMKEVKSIAEDVNLDELARLTAGAAGADLANIVNEAILLAASHNPLPENPTPEKEEAPITVHMKDFVEAIERGAIGLTRKNRILNADEKKRVAIHEAGHALVACCIPEADPVHKITIMPRGPAGGYVLQRPEHERFLTTKKQLEAQIKVALGGTIAEELLLGDISTGAAGDLKMATRIAVSMVREFGMSELGRVYYGSDPSVPPDQLTTSEDSFREIDLEVRKLVQACLDEVRRLLGKHQNIVQDVSEMLIREETIEGKQLKKHLREKGFPLSPSAQRYLDEPNPSISSGIVKPVSA